MSAWVECKTCNRGFVRKSQYPDKVLCDDCEDKEDLRAELAAVRERLTKCMDYGIDLARLVEALDHGGEFQRKDLHHSNVAERVRQKLAAAESRAQSLQTELNHALGKLDLAVEDARADALEEAARVADEEFAGSKRNMAERETGFRISERIRALIIHSAKGDGK